jgi:hypothetical protein
LPAEKACILHRNANSNAVRCASPCKHD